VPATHHTCSALCVPEAALAADQCDHSGGTCTSSSTCTAGGTASCRQRCAQGAHLDWVTQGGACTVHQSTQQNTDDGKLR
jgi:hypothetical protein